MLSIRLLLFYLLQLVLLLVRYRPLWKQPEKGKRACLHLPRSYPLILSAHLFLSYPHTGPLVLTSSYPGLRGPVFPNIYLKSYVTCTALLSVAPGHLVVRTQLGEWGFSRPLSEPRPTLPSAGTAQSWPGPHHLTAALFPTNHPSPQFQNSWCSRRRGASPWASSGPSRTGADIVCFEQVNRQPSGRAASLPPRAS